MCGEMARNILISYTDKTNYKPFMNLFIAFCALENQNFILIVLGAWRLFKLEINCIQKSSKQRSPSLKQSMTCLARDMHSCRNSRYSHWSCLHCEMNVLFTSYLHIVYDERICRSAEFNNHALNKIAVF